MLCISADAFTPDAAEVPTRYVMATPQLAFVHKTEFLLLVQVSILILLKNLVTMDRVIVKCSARLIGVER